MQPTYTGSKSKARLNCKVDLHSPKTQEILTCMEKAVLRPESTFIKFPAELLLLLSICVRRVAVR